VFISTQFIYAHSSQTDLLKNNCPQAALMEPAGSVPIMTISDDRFSCSFNPSARQPLKFLPQKIGLVSFLPPLKTGRKEA
jgi:hypothetical protein